jgi:hypothetical protein
MNKKQTKESEDWIANRIQYAKDSIKTLKKSARMLTKGSCHFRIQLISLWKAEGEKGIRYDAPIGESLGKAAKIADEMFMKQNRRSDIQAHRVAHLIIEDEKGETLEAIYMEHPHEERKRREEKRIQLERRKQKVDKESTTVS